MNNILTRIRRFVIHADIGVLFIPLSAFILLFISFLLNMLLFKSSGFALIFFAPVSFLLPCFIYLRLNKANPLSLRTPLPQKDQLLLILFAFAAVCALSLFFNFLFYKEETLVLYGSFGAKTKNFFAGALYFISFGLLAPILEEITFRRLLLPKLASKGIFSATVASSLLFSLIDLDISHIPARFFAGMLLCLLFYATKSLLSCISVHILYNIFALYLQPVLLAMKKVSGQAELFLFLIAAAALLFLALFFSQASSLYKKYSIQNRSADYVKKETPSSMPQMLLDLVLNVPFLACLLIFIIAIIIK